MLTVENFEDYPPNCGRHGGTGCGAPDTGRTSERPGGTLEL